MDASTQGGVVEPLGERSPPPLEGIRVLDLTQVLAGPFCTMTLADLGADVVKIEHPDTGDDSRHFGPFLPSGMSIYFAGVNRGKRSVALDLKSAQGAATLRQLACRADVLVENLRPGALDRLGLGPQTLMAGHPGLIYASISGFGRGGVRARRPAYDIIAQAMSGLMSVTGDPGGPGVRVGVSISDTLGGLFGVIGILAALHGRLRTGRGRRLDVALLDSTVAATENALGRFSATGEVPSPLGTRHPAITPFQAYAAADRPLVIAAGNDRLFAVLCETLGHGEWAKDARFATNALRTRHHEALAEVLAPVLATRLAGDWLDGLEAAGVPCALVATIPEVVADPHLAARGMLHTMRDAMGGSFTTAGSPLLFDGYPARLSSRCPALGEDTRAVLADWLSEPAAATRS